MTLKRVERMQINSSEVSFYTDLESFRLLFDIDFTLFWSHSFSSIWGNFTLIWVISTLGIRTVLLF